MPRERTPCIEHILQLYHALFIKYMNKVLWCCHTFALDSTTENGVVAASPAKHFSAISRLGQLTKECAK